MERITECGIRQFIVDKILKGCSKKGWIGLRNLKTYLRSISPHDCDNGPIKSFLDQRDYFFIIFDFISFLFY